MRLSLGEKRESRVRIGCAGEGDDEIGKEAGVGFQADGAEVGGEEKKEGGVRRVRGVDEGLEDESVVLLVGDEVTAAHESEETEGEIGAGVHGRGGDEGV